MAIRRFRETFKWLIWLVAIAFIGWLGLELGANILNFNWTRKKPWQEGIVAEIGDYQLTVQEYDAFVQRAIAETLKVRGVDEISPNEEEAIRDAVFYQLVDMIRWKKLADKYNIKLSDKTILALVTLLPPPEIRSDTLFNRDGQFNYQLYLQVLNDKRYAPIFAAYEAELKREIPVEILRSLVVKVPSISKYELWKRYEERNTKYGFSFVNIVYAQIKDTPTGLNDSKLKEFYNKHKKDFTDPPRADIYVVRVEKAPLKADSIQAEELAKKAYEDAKENWESAVKSYSEDTRTRDNGGVIGWFARDDLRLPPEMRAAIAEADSGSVLGPFALPFGWDIVKVTSVNSTGDSVELAHILITVKMSYQSKQEIRDSVIKFSEEARKIKDNKKFADLVRKYGFKLDSTGMFSLSEGFIPFIGPDRTLLSWIRRAKVNEVSNVVYKPGAYLVVRLLNKSEGGVQPYEKVKDEVKRKYVMDYKKRKALEILEGIRSKLSSGFPLDSVPSLYPDLRITVGDKDSTSYDDFVPGLVAKDLFFALLKRVKKGSWQGPYSYETGAYLVFKRYEIKPNRKDFDEQFTSLLLQEMQNEAMKFVGNFSRELEDLYPLKDYRGYLY